MNPDIKIVLLIPTSKLGGAEKLLRNIAVYYLNRSNRVEIHILKRTSSSWDDLETKAQIKYYSNTNVFLGMFNFFYSINLELHSYLFSSHVSTNCLFGLLKKINKNKQLKLICRESTDVFYRFSGLRLAYYKFLYYISYSSIDLLIFQTLTMSKSFKSNIFKKLYSLNSVTIPNPISLRDDETENIPELLTSKSIVSAGRLIPEKGFDLLINAFNKFHINNKDYRLLILGEGQERNNLQKKINSLKLNDAITLFGHVDNPLNYFKTAEICIVSSRTEGFPNVLLEMMSQNTKVVSTLCAGDIEKIEGVLTINTNSEQEIFEALTSIKCKNTTSNRLLFDKELKSRSIDKYLLIINNKLE